MASEVKIQYNPFLPQLMVLVDGKQPDGYSRLTQFADEDIWKWHSEILEVLYSEIRDDFFVIFVGTALDTAIMKSVCERNRHCLGFTAELPVVNISLQKRLGKLNQFIKNNSGMSYQKSILRAYFFIPAELKGYAEDIRSLDIRNLFCSTEISVSDQAECYFENNENSFLFILAKDVSDGEQAVRKYHSQNPVFVLYQGSEMKMKRVDSSYIMYEYDSGDVVSAIFNCFLGFPLLYAFQNCVQSILHQRLRESEVLKLASITPTLEVEIEKNVEIGKSNRIQISVTPPDAPPPKVIFRVLDERIARTDNLCVFGLKPGRTLLEAYYYGTQKPFQICELNVIKRNRIKKIILNEDELVLGTGDRKILHCDYSPVNADNIDKIEWKSSDETIASVNSHGTVICKSCGTCKIWCIAENVSTVCTCEVRPYLESLDVDLSDNSTDGQLYLEPMQEYELKINVYPSNSIDRNYTITSSNYNIANVIGKKILAKNTGTATIEIENISGRKKTAVVVKVSKAKRKFLKKLFQK